MPSPSIVPADTNQQSETVYIVIEDFGSLGRAYRETDVERVYFDTILDDFLTGQYPDAVRVVAFNIAEGWSSDASRDIAQELRRRCDLDRRDMPSSIQGFVEQYEGPASANWGWFDKPRA